MAYHNINAAGLIGATKWAKILSIYQILEPRRNKSEVEWRIVNPNPNYSISSDSKQAISEVSPPKGWANVVSLLKIEKEDITAFTCPNGKGQILKASLPEQYSKVRILELY